VRRVFADTFYWLAIFIPGDEWGETTVEVVAQSHESFLAGLALYERRPDKEYSLVDCISMNVMRLRGIWEILTHDRHFSQEGFVRLADR